MPNIIARRRILGGGTFSPASLFAGGVAGAWWDPSDMSTLFQDDAGTIPITADGEPVGRINDKSGNGHFLSTPTAANRPLFRQSGSIRWLEFDGVNDALQNLTGPVLVQPITTWSAAALTTVPPAATALLCDGGINTNRNIISVTVGTSNLFMSSSGPNIGGVNQIIGAGADFVSSHVFNSPSSSIRVNNGTVTTGDCGAQGLTGLTLGARFSLTTLLWPGKFHGFVTVQGNIEAQYGAQMRTWLAAKQGRVL